MKAAKRFSALVVALLAGVFVLGVVGTASSDAAPYRHAAAIAVSTANPQCGGSMTVSGTDFMPNETVTVTLHSRTINLGTAHTDASGSFTTGVTLPAGVDGHHTITVTGASGDSASARITIANCTGGAGVAAVNTGGPAVTGVAIFAITAVGLLLIAGGALLLLGGRRRRAAA